MKAKFFILFYLAVIVFSGCQSNLPKQPPLLPTEKHFFDSLKGKGEWCNIERTMTNVDSIENEIFKPNYTASWNSPYSYAISFITPDSLFFEKADSILAKKLCNKLYKNILPPKNIKRLIIVIEYLRNTNEDYVLPDNSKGYNFECINNHLLLIK